MSGPKEEAMSDKVKVEQRHRDAASNLSFGGEMIGVPIGDSVIMSIRYGAMTQALADAEARGFSEGYGTSVADEQRFDARVCAAAENMVEAAVQEKVGPLREALRDGLEAFRYTREYIGEESLPAIPGWSWFDWCEMARALLESGGDDES